MAQHRNTWRWTMPVFTRPDAEIYYEVHGSGYPLLLFAPAPGASEKVKTSANCG